MSKILKVFISVQICFFALAVGSPLNAQSGIYDRVGIIPGHGAFGSLPEENIDLFTGNVTLSYRDVYLPGPNGLDVEVWRVYNSKILKDRQSGNPVVQAYHRSWVGMGWTIHMGMVHNWSSSAPVIEFPDGRLETAYPNNYSLGPNVYLTRDFLKYDKTCTPPTVYPKLYFKNGVIWTFGATATITRADGTSDPVRLVTKIENAYGHHIDIAYDPGLPTIEVITDSAGRSVEFLSSGSPKKLTGIRVIDANGEYRTFSYSVGNFANGYHRLESFTPPMLPATTFEYLDGTSGRFELVRMTTSYGGVLEYSYADHTFDFNGISLISRIVAEKRITFNPDEDAAVWNFTYPTYQGVATGTVEVDGPVYDTNVTYNAYSVSTPWKIGLIGSRQASDASFVETLDWTFQQISTTSWTVLGTNMGTAKGPLITSVIEGRIGDATGKTEYIYDPNRDPKKYGLPTRINSYIGSSGPLKSYTNLSYFYEAHPGFKTRHMLEFVSHLEVGSDQGILRKADMAYYEELGKWGALKQVKRWKVGSTYLTWDYGYTCSDPNLVDINIDPPGSAAAESVHYSYGIKISEVAPDFTRLTRLINSRDSSIVWEQGQDQGYKFFDYDNLGRIEDVDLTGMGPLNGIHYDWRPNGENRVVITQGGNVVTRFWDGMGRDTGSIETGDGLTLHSRKALDAEGRVVSESKGSLNPAHVYSYLYNAAGQITRITDPLTHATTIGYSGTTKTVTDPESHATVYEYGDLPGLPTRVTDALGHSAVYAYDALGRLASVVFNGTRTHAYTYDGLDNILTEQHPETGLITYAYNPENLLASKSWGGSTLGFIYDASRRLARTTATPGNPIDTVDYTYSSTTGRVQNIRNLTTGWKREYINYNPFGLLVSETITIPGLAPKRLTYGYDENLNLESWKEDANPGSGVAIGHNGLNMPETISFNGAAVVAGASYGPNKMPATISFGNQTVFSSNYNNAGMPIQVSLTKNGTTLYDAAYTYDGVGNITGIASTAPALTSTFGYDALNRLTSASYSAGRAGTYAYEYDEYGNMLRVQENGGTVFQKSYLQSNRISGFSYDDRGNLLFSGGNLYYWDAQNRLQSVRTTSGAILGKYLYDDRGLRLMAVPPTPEINVKHESVVIPDGGEAYLSAPPGQSVNEVLTIENLGDADLALGTLAISGAAASDFSVVAQPSSPVAPLGSTTFTIQFHPLTSGQKIALLTIPSNDIDEGQYEINLYGNYEPEIDIPEVADGGDWDFGSVVLGESWDETFTIRNLGNKDLVLGGTPVVAITGRDASHFQVLSQPSSPIGPGGSRTFVIRFAPLSSGPKIAEATIVNNDWDENPYNFDLQGTGEIGEGKAAEETAFVVTSPAEGDELVPGAVHLVAWTGAEDVGDVRLEYSLDNGSTFQTIVERTANTGGYPWYVPPAAAGSCLVRVSSADGTAAKGQTLSLEFKIKISPAANSSGDGSFLFHASIPDPLTGSAWTASVCFRAGNSGTGVLRFNSAEAPALEKFLDRWHVVRIILGCGIFTGSILVDGEVVLSGIPLVQGLWSGPSPELTLISSGTSVIRVEDFEARYRDAALKPEIEGSDVSQRLVKDSFELYPVGTFPLEGGWQDGSLLAAGVTEGGEPAKEGQPVIRAVVDDGDSYRGLQSLKLGRGDLTEGVVSKRLSLPARAPFGVGEGSFAIGVARKGSEAALLPRRRLVADADADDLPEPTPVSDESVLSPEVPSSGTPSGEPMVPLSALPVGNYYIYSFDGRLMQVYDMFGALLKDYIYMGDRLVAEYDHVGARFLYYTPDQINSTRVVTDQAGNVVYSAAHDPYGGIQQTWVSDHDPQLKFSGKERDTESELDYFGARYYDRSQYRFISVDPVVTAMASQADSQLWNKYIYCRNNPIIYKDFTGKYGPEFHYGLTLYCALQVGFSYDEAVTIAQACRYVDENPDTESFAHPEYHFPTFGSVLYLEDMSVETGNLAFGGTTCHPIQDSESHYGLSWGLSSLWAHVFMAPDKPSSDVGKAIEATDNTIDFLYRLKNTTNESPMTMTVDTALLTAAFKKDMDPITYIASIVVPVLISISLLR